jgi:Uncharacterised protein family (UPF0158)
MRELPVDFKELVMAMEDHTGETQYYLDLETGEVHCLTPDILAFAYRVDVDLSTLAEWEQEPARVMLAVEIGDPRYEQVPQVCSHDVYNVMVEFAQSVSDRRLAGMLELALDGKGAFGRFKHALDNYPREAERWYAVKQAWFDSARGCTTWRSRRFASRRAVKGLQTCIARHTVRGR